MSEVNEPRLLPSNPDRETASRICCPFNTTRSNELIWCEGSQCAAFRQSKIYFGQGYCKIIDRDFGVTSMPLNLHKGDNHAQ